VERGFVSPPAEVRDFARLYRLLVRQLSHFAVFMTDLNGVILSWNEGVRTILGYSENEFVGQPMQIVFTPEDLAAGVPEKEIATAVRDGSASDERWQQRKDGSTLFVDGQLSAIYDERGELVGFSKIMRDATPRKTAESALERSNQELSHFAYMVSHDLQAPLRTVSLYAELLAQKLRGDEKEVAQYLNFIQRSAGQMQKLIHDLLTYSQVSSDGPASELVPLEKTLAQAMRNHQAAIEESGAVVTHDPLPVVRCNEMQIVQVFQNLLGNAVKYRSDEPPRIHVSAVREDKFWKISVKDNGIGIAPEYHQRIFEPFKRLHGSAKPGSGVGLAIVKKVVERCGGRVWVDSAAGAGSTFYFTLPA
jgi:PAS domain S-box-containing protein